MVVCVVLLVVVVVCFLGSFSIRNGGLLAFISFAPHHHKVFKCQRFKVVLWLKQ